MGAISVVAYFEHTAKRYAHALGCTDMEKKQLPLSSVCVCVSASFPFEVKIFIWIKTFRFRRFWRFFVCFWLCLRLATRYSMNTRHSTNQRTWKDVCLFVFVSVFFSFELSVECVGRALIIIIINLIWSGTVGSSSEYNCIIVFEYIDASASLPRQPIQWNWLRHCVAYCRQFFLFSFLLRSSLELFTKLTLSFVSITINIRLNGKRRMNLES